MVTSAGSRTQTKQPLSITLSGFLLAEVRRLENPSGGH